MVGTKLFVLAVLVALMIVVPWKSVRADDPTPVPDITTPAATVDASTPVVEPTDLPTVTREGSHPIATSVAPPPVAPEARPTVTSVVDQAPSPTELPVAPQPVDTPDSASEWPSPDQLRENARLRWGTRVPDSVRRWAFLIVPAAKKYHLDPNLIAAVMTMESNGDPLALSPADARGLMQVLHGPWDPKQNVDLGSHMLADLYAEFDDWSLALAGYNAGAGAVQAYGGIPPFRETRDYVIVVTYLWDVYGHHHLTGARKRLYRSTLKDLEHFKDQRKKIPKLAHIAHIDDTNLTTCVGSSCETPLTAPSDNVDPFWLMGDVPDPLQRVNPYDGAASTRQVTGDISAASKA